MKMDYFGGDVAELSVDVAVFAVDPAAWDAGNWPAGLSTIDRALGGWVRDAVRNQAFSPKGDASLIVQTHGRAKASHVAIIGLPALTDDNPVGAVAARIRDTAARASKLGESVKASSVHLVLPQDHSIPATNALRCAFEGAALGTYRFNKYRKEEDRKPNSVSAFSAQFLTSDGAAATSTETDTAVARAAATGVVEAISFARDIVNEPPNVIYPESLAAHAMAIAQQAQLECKIYGAREIAEMKMELLEAVNVGSDKEPRLIHLIYRPENADATTPHVAIVGKGITFDSGGYSLKPMGAIDDMKIDMAGAAAVLGAMKAIRTVSPKVVVHAVVPAAENLVSGRAYKLGDVYRGHNGKTVEIRNTDAEGRLILMDAMGYALRQGVSEITTLATLTGACVIALGPHTAGLFSSNRSLRDAYTQAADAAGEDMWALPMSKKLRPMLKSEVADVKNVGERWGGAITAALFLEEFADGIPFAHIDLAGPAYVEKSVEAHNPKGGTGFGVLTLLEYLRNR